MTGNPFHDELDDTFRGTRVRVQATEHTYEGWVRLWHYHQPAIILYDAVREDGEHLGAVTVDDPEVVERLASQGTIEEIPLDALTDSPYSVREPDDVDHKQFIKLTRERGHLLTFPTVRPIDHDPDSDNGTAGATVDRGYEVMIGHRRVATARKAGLDTIAVRVRELDDWEAVEHFVDDHIPIPDAGEDGLYSQQEIQRAITQLRTDWPDEQLLELDPLAPHLREQLASTRQGSLRHAAEDGRN